MGVLNDLNSLAGNVAKASLFFPNIEVSDTTTEYSTCQTLLNGLDAIADALSSVDVTGSVASLKKALDSVLSDTKTLQVQFNPASLIIDAHGGGRVPISNYSSENGKSVGTISYGPLAVYINISFTLIFDSTFIADAFASDKFNTSASSILNGAMSAVTTGATGKEYTVRPFVEGFLAAMRDPDHRTLIFQWGKMRYVGTMNSLGCKYTLFNPNGEPIRAEVQVNMFSDSHPHEEFKVRTDDKGISTKYRTGETLQNDNDYLGYWTKRYMAIVGGKDYLSGTTLKNVATNLLNL